MKHVPFRICIIFQEKSVACFIDYMTTRHKVSGTPYIDLYLIITVLESRNTNQDQTTCATKENQRTRNVFQILTNILYLHQIESVVLLIKQLIL